MSEQWKSFVKGCVEGRSEYWIPPIDCIDLRCSVQLIGFTLHCESFFTDGPNSGVRVSCIKVKSTHRLTAYAYIYRDIDKLACLEYARMGVSGNTYRKIHQLSFRCLSPHRFAELWGRILHWDLSFPCPTNDSVEQWWSKAVDDALLSQRDTVLLKDFDE